MRKIVELNTAEIQDVVGGLATWQSNFVASALSVSGSTTLSATQVQAPSSTTTTTTSTALLLKK